MLALLLCGSLLAVCPLGMPFGVPATPSSCPRGGFPFVADFTFMDGTTATAKSNVPCPPRRHK
jgi:hypothetical protein